MVWFGSGHNDEKCPQRMHLEGGKSNWSYTQEVKFMSFEYPYMHLDEITFLELV